MLKTNKDRIEEMVETFSQMGKTDGGGVTRLALSKEDQQARQEVVNRMEAIGAEIKVDDLGNIYATLPGSEDLPAIMAGSHTDSVVRGGNYDGILGVITAMETAERIVEEGIDLRHPYTVAVWTNEEGARFDPALMVSGILTDHFDEEKMKQSTDTEGVTFGEALDASGWKGEKENRFDPEKTRALFELHIEQGPVLEAEGKDIGVVQGVNGMVNYDLTFKGQASHAGTFPMPFRKDALLAAAETITWLHGELDQLDKDLVYTTGRINTYPNVHTIVPDEVRLTFEARHTDPEVLQQVVEVIESLPQEVAKCEASFEKQWGRETVDFDAEVIESIEEATKDLGYSYNEMYSGAGHDAQYIATVAPASMIFIPSKDGLSHNEAEYSTIDECWKGANVLLNAVLSLDKK